MTPSRAGNEQTTKNLLFCLRVPSQGLRELWDPHGSPGVAALESLWGCHSSKWLRRPSASCFLMCLGLPRAIFWSFLFCFFSPPSHLRYFLSSSQSSLCSQGAQRGHHYSRVRAGDVTHLCTGTGRAAEISEAQLSLRN